MQVNMTVKCKWEEQVVEVCETFEEMGFSCFTNYLDVTIAEVPIALLQSFAIKLDTIEKSFL